MRLINADKAVKDIEHSADLGGALGNVVECVKLYAKFMIATSPTVDAVEVVRCRDCKYAEENWNGKDIYCLRTSSFPWSNDSFCSDGERKDGDSDD